MSEAKITVKGNKLIVEIDLEELGPSSSGKTQLVINQNGQKAPHFQYNGHDVQLNMTGYYKTPKS